MAIKETNDLITIHVPTKEAGYEFNGRIWTKSSAPQIWADKVLYCGIRGAKIQTLDDAVEFRHDTNGTDGSAESQHTGTLLAVVKDGTALRAHVYEPEQDELEQLAAREEIKMGRAGCIDVASNSDLGKRILQSTKNTGRTFIVPEKDLVLSVTPEGGQTDYGTNDAVLQLMPKNAEKNAAYIARIGLKNGYVCWLDRPNLESEQMRIRPVGLGGDGYYNVDDVGSNFGISRRARGVVPSAQKSSHWK